MQRVPKVSSDDVLRVIRRDYPAAEVGRVRTILDRYGAEPWERERDRVQLAVLKLAAGNVDELVGQIEAAKRDYRDALAQAEYPENLVSALPASEVPAAEREAIDERDWEQYWRWLGAR
jgi:hypothetical protein